MDYDSIYQLWLAIGFTFIVFWFVIQKSKKDKRKEKTATDNDGNFPVQRTKAVIIFYCVRIGLLALFALIIGIALYFNK